MTTPSPCCNDEMGKGAFTGLIHCFTGTQRLGRCGAGAGLLYFGLRHRHLQEFRRACANVIKIVPLDRLLVETDAPFLAPVPHRGQDATNRLSSCTPPRCWRS